MWLNTFKINFVYDKIMILLFWYMFCVYHTSFIPRLQTTLVIWIFCFLFCFFVFILFFMMRWVVGQPHQKCGAIGEGVLT
jgi:hypothetical protein